MKKLFMAIYFPKRGKKQTNSKKGAVTVEAALVLPVFLCIVISVVFVIKTVYTYELMQHAITETADEMATAGYILHVSGLGGLNTKLESGMQERAKIFSEHVNALFAGFESLGGFFKAGEAIGDIASHPAEELKNAAFFAASGAFEDLKTQFFTPLVKVYMEKYLVSGSSTDADKRLKALNIHNGFGGLDFSESNFLIDQGNEITIVVKYKIDLPVPLKVFPELNIRQKAAAQAWMGGDEARDSINEDEADDLWALDNFSRGRKVQSIFGANLPFNFPVIAKFEEGTATMIKSMDLTAESYKESKNITHTLEGYLAAFNAFTGQEEPWGSKKIVIRQQDIKQKVLLLVIPKNRLEPKTEALLADFAGNAAIKGIKLVIERYGIKKLKDEAAP